MEAKQQDIAIIGISGRFPEADTIEEFRTNLINGRDSVRQMDSRRIAATFLASEATYRPLGYIVGIDYFDYSFFGLSKQEASAMDPHQRILLEVVHEAFESAGIVYQKNTDSDISVYGADLNQEYFYAQKEYTDMSLSGSSNIHLSGLIAKVFGTKGNNCLIDTACSSSLTALKYACDDLKSGRSEMAVVFGAHLVLNPATQDDFTEGEIVSVSSKCKAYAEGADGIGTGEAVVSILIKKLADAELAGDPVYAVIKGVGLNQDAARSTSFTAPSSEAQTELIRKVWKNAGVKASEIGYIEGHGTGTKLGDPIEIEALNNTIGNISRKILIGSVKTNIGHTDTCSGLTGLVKAVLSLKYHEYYPSLHFDSPNPFIDFENASVAVSTQYSKWEAESKRYAGVSSFGFSGTNAHVLLSDYLSEEKTSENAELLVFSAKSIFSLISSLKRCRLWLEKNPDASLASVAYTLNKGRMDYSEYRLALVCQTIPDMLHQLELHTKKMILPEQPFGINFTQELQDNILNAPDKEILENILSLSSLENRVHTSGNYLDYPGLLPHLAEAYMNKADINWDIYYNNVKHSILPLPGYSFEKKRCWTLKETFENNILALSTEQFAENNFIKLDLENNHFDEVQLHKDKGYILHKTLLPTDWICKDHQQNGLPLLPASGLIAIVYEAFKLIQKQNVEFRDLVFHEKCLVLNDRVQLLMQIEIQERGYTFSVSGHEEDGLTVYFTGSAFGHEESEHISSVIMKNWGSYFETSINNINKNRVEGEYTRHVEEFSFGERWTSVWESIQYSDDEAIAGIFLPDHLKKDLEKYQLHPSMLDFCLSILSGTGVSNFFASCQKIKVYRSIPQFCLIQLDNKYKRSSEFVQVFDFTVWTSCGELILEIEGLYMVRQTETEALIELNNK